MKSAISVVENGISVTANRNARWIQVRLRSLRSNWLELRPLPDPEDTERQEAHQIDDQPRRQRRQHAQQLGLAAHHLAGGHPQIQHQQRHRNREQPVAERRQPLDAAAVAISL